MDATSDNVLAMPAPVPPGDEEGGSLLELADGKTYRLVFDGVAIMALDDLMGINFIEGKFIPNNATRLRALLWACTRAHHPELTLEDVGDLVLAANMTGVMAAVYQLLSGNAKKDPDSLAPFVPSHLEVVEKALALSGLREGQRFADLGCGDGRVLAKAFAITKTHVLGYEYDAGRAKQSRDLLELMKIDGRIVEDKIQNADLLGIDVVFVYLLTESNARLKAKLLQFLKPGAKVVSHDFPMPGWTSQVEERFVIADGDNPEAGISHSVFVYEIGEGTPAE